MPPCLSTDPAVGDSGKSTQQESAATLAQEELERQAVGEAIDAPLVGLDGEDRSQPNPRSVQRHPGVLSLRTDP